MTPTPPAVLALDPAKKTGIAFGVPGGKPVLATVNFARELDDPADVFARAMKWIERALDGSLDIAAERGFGPPALLAIEAPIPPSQKPGMTTFDTTVIAIGLSAIFRGAARARGIPVRMAHISTWRKYALGKGNLPGSDAKRAMIRLVHGLWGETVDDNAADAAGIFLWAAGQVAPERVQRHEPLFLPRGRTDAAA